MFTNLWITQPPFCPQSVRARSFCTGLRGPVEQRTMKKITSQLIRIINRSIIGIEPAPMADHEENHTPFHNLRYVFRDAEYYLPWTRPDMQRLKLWYMDMVSEFPAIERECEIGLFGKYWSNYAPKTWHAELHLVPIDRAIQQDDFLALAASILPVGYRTAIQEYRLAIDFSATELSRLQSLYDQFLDIELENRSSIDATGHSRSLGLPYRVDHHSEGSWSVILDHSSNRAVEAQPELVGRAEPDYARTTAQIKNKNLIHFKPVSLRKLFGPIDPSSGTV